MPFCLRLILLLLVPLAASTVEAGALYKCAGKDGVTAFTSSRTGFSNCKLVGNFASPPPSAPDSVGSGKPSAPAASGSPSVEFRTAAGNAEPRAVTAPAGSRPRVQRGAVYKYVKNGVTHYTNRRPAGQRAQVLFSYIETCFACNVWSPLDFHDVALNLDSYRDEVVDASLEHGVDAALIRAIIHAESAFNPNAISRVGAQGLMQLMPATATRFGVTDAFKPSENIKGGVSYLAWLSKRFDGDVRRIAAAYNAGEGAVARYGGVPPYDETRVFVERVGILHGRYRDALAPTTAAASVAPAASGASN